MSGLGRWRGSVVEWRNLSLQRTCLQTGVNCWLSVSRHCPEETTAAADLRHGAVDVGPDYRRLQEELRHRYR